MGWIMPEIVVQRLLDIGVKALRANKEEFFDLFSQFVQEDLIEDYGPKYLDEIWQWFSTTKIPIVKAWSLNVQQIPCFSVHLANETEDESKAAIGDTFGTTHSRGDVGTGVFTVMIDIGVHANKAGDHVLWMYYIASYIMFKHKLTAERLGLKLQTFSASDYNKDAAKMTDNIWTRWIRFRCTTENFWSQNQGLKYIADVNTDLAIDQPYAHDIAATHDVDLDCVDRTFNRGFVLDTDDDMSI